MAAQAHYGANQHRRTPDAGGDGVTAFFTGTTPLLIFLAAQFTLGAIGTCAWNAWLRDLAPENRLGQVFAKRTVWLTAINLVLGLAAALALDLTGAGSHARNVVFASMFAAGCVTGVISARIVTRMSEPLMPPPGAPVRLLELLRQPLQDQKFQPLVGLRRQLVICRQSGDAGGLLADFFANRKLELLLRWSNPSNVFSVPVVLTNWDFHFLLAGIIGVYAMHRLALVAERGEIEQREMVSEVLKKRDVAQHP